MISMGKANFPSATDLSVMFLHPNSISERRRTRFERWERPS
jgi:hypothetical protein